MNVFLDCKLMSMRSFKTMMNEDMMESNKRDGDVDVDEYEDDFM